MQIYLVRHTTPQIEKGICYGQSDIFLSDNFEDEAAKIYNTNLLPKENVCIYSSPLVRCKLLAKKLFVTNIIYDERLMELHFGDWELQPWSDIDPQELNVWMNDFVHHNCPNGESYTDLYQRVLSFIAFLKLQDHGNVIIVTHAGIIRAFLSHYHQTDLKDSFQYKVAYGEIIMINL